MLTFHHLRLLVAATAAGFASACAIADGTAFGLPYTIAQSPAPSISSGDILFTATFTSACPSDSVFEASLFGDYRGDSVMLTIARSESPGCHGIAHETTISVRTPLPADAVAAATRYLSCPPGSHFEMVKLSDEVSAALPSFLSTRKADAMPIQPPEDWDEEEDGPWEPPLAASAAGQVVVDDSTAFADPVAEAARVEEELATQSPEDSVAFLAHCEEKQAAGQPSPCCSQLMMEGLRKKIALEAAAQSTPEVANASQQEASHEEVTVDSLGGAAHAAALSFESVA